MAEESRETELGGTRQSPSEPTVSAGPGAVEYARAAHGNLQDMVRLADQKAATLMGASGVIVALLGSNLVDKLQAHSAALPTYARAAALLLLLGAALCSISVLLPRFPCAADVVPVVGAPQLMWGLSKYYRTPGDYIRPLLAVTAAETVADLGYENLKVTWILERKWKWLGWAARLLFGAFLVWALAIVWALRG